MIEMPDRISQLPRDDKGRPVPFFVQWIDGKPDFRVMDGAKFVRCIDEKLCWVCGGKLGTYKAFVIGPMCAVNRTSAEPPSHLECAIFSVQACPFLTTPKMHRRERDLPEGWQSPGGVMIERNPGVTLVWVTKSYWIIPDGQGGVVCKFGDPHQIAWYCEGRAATRIEVEESIDAGLPFLKKIAEEDGPMALFALGKAIAGVVPSLLPQEAP